MYSCITNRLDIKSYHNHVHTCTGGYKVYLYSVQVGVIKSPSV